MITIVDYDAGNIRSIVNMLRTLGVRSRISNHPAEILEAERLILPGVGHFDYGMRNLIKRGLVDALAKRVLDDGVPILGICLGAQLLTRSSDEGDRLGLGWIEARTVRFDRTRMDARLRVPHMGWAETWSLRDNPMTCSIPDDARFYYVHSYHLVCDRDENALLAARHGYDFTAAIGQKNILGVQFHPEKSHRFGSAVLRSFSTWQPSFSAQARSDAA